ncbi:MAG: molybdate ABC transporter substrate-binding protein [Bacteriovoracaceae bacterium]|nr:molybdate ABC transporter substrate-binding protein [Bacteriovoracaceae bacterium]
MLKLFIISSLLLSFGSRAEVLNIAVSSNFQKTSKLIAKSFQKETGHKVKLSFASTGKHFAQILNGAPFDIFFGADTKHPQKLRDMGFVSGEVSTYAIGKLVFWYPNKSNLNTNSLFDPKIKYISMANEVHAPYGIAAKEFLIKTGNYKKLKSKLVRGENISQTFLFTRLGNANAGFVALSQVIDVISQSDYILIPESSYTPIAQGVVALKRTKNKQLVNKFLNYLNEKPIIELIKRSGYTIKEL